MGNYSTPGGQNADILRATINGESYGEPPTSEISELLNASLTQKQRVIENPSGVTADPLSVCNYIKGITSDAQSFKGVSFTVLANSLNWYSGNIWGDGGHTWWGIVIERNSNVETQKVYKYYADDDLSTSAVTEL